MGNLVKDFWTYTYKNKSYYGICEVVGGDLKKRSSKKKYETKINRALAYMMRDDINYYVSHMSIQTYNAYLGERPGREENEETYYPFFIEIEPHEKAGNEFLNQYKVAVCETYHLVRFLMNELGVKEDDIVIMINAARSLYVHINPKAYGLKPSRELHLIYKEMYNILSQKILEVAKEDYMDSYSYPYADTSIESKTTYFDYADDKMYKYNSLIKVPNAYYKGGYQVQISFEELTKLLQDPKAKKELTRSKRDILNKKVPGELSKSLQRIYIEAKERVKQTKLKYKKNTETREKASEKVSYIKLGKPGCIEHIERSILEKGIRNSGLVSLAIYYKNMGYTQKQVIDILLEYADKWKHDEDESIIKAKVRSVFRKDTTFSCQYVREYIGEECSCCSSCKYKKKEKKAFKIHKTIIDDLWTNKASKRHYIAYLKLSREDLYDTWFNPKEIGMNDRDIRELCNRTSFLKRIKNRDKICIMNNANLKAYLLPNAFIDMEAYKQLGEHLKHYLKLIFSGYKAFDKYIIMRVTKERIKEILEYDSNSGVNKFIKKLKDLGYLVTKKKYVVALYYTSNKVINIDDHRKASKDPQKGNIAPNTAFEANNQYSNYGQARKLIYNTLRGSP